MMMEKKTNKIGCLGSPLCTFNMRCPACQEEEEIDRQEMNGD